MLRKPWIALSLLLAWPLQASAQDDDTTLDPLAIEVHGFASQGFLLGLRNNYLAEDKHGSFEFSEIGINFTKQLGDRMRLGLQLFARDLGPTGNYDANVDWFYIDYKFFDWLGLRAGRVKLPFGLYNEVNDIDAARAFVLLPQSLYPASNRQFLLAQTGIELYGYVNLHRAGALDYRVYGGADFIESETRPSADFQIEAVNIPWIAGGRLFWETPVDGLRIGGSLQVLRLDIDALASERLSAPLQEAGALPADFDGKVTIEAPVLLWVGSIEYAAYDLLLALEFSRWHSELDSGGSPLVPEDPNTEDRMYALAAYRINTWLQPGIYYGLYFPHSDDRHGRENQQHDVALCVRFDINQYWLVKLEGHVMEGTAALQPDLNDGTPRSELKHSWGLLLAKTTAYF